MLGLVDSGTVGLLERNSFSINITFTKMKIKTKLTYISRSCVRFGFAEKCCKILF